MDMSSLGDLGKLAKEMKNAYADGLGAMDKANEEAVKNIKPDHEVELDIQLSAKVESHDYEVDAKVVFEIELKPILTAKGGDLEKALGGLDVDLGDDKDAVMKQLGQPRAVGRVKSIDTKKLKISDKKGPAKLELNKKATLLATLKKQKLHFNCEGVFSYPGNTDVFVAIPSTEKMQKNIAVDIKKFDKKIKFSWTEKDKDNLKIKGTLKIKKL